MRRLSPIALVLAALFGAPAAEAAGAPAALTAAPGTVVRWPGAGIERCGMGGEEWVPIAGACWYAIDLLTPPGPLELSRRREGGREKAVVTVGKYPYETQSLQVDDRQVHLSPADLARSERESAAVGKLWGRRGEPRFALPLGAPLARLPESARFGARRVFNGETRSPHSGADYKAATGTPVMAVADATVALAADHFFSGGSVFLDHGDGLFSMYFHLSKIDVKAGAEVRRGQKIGEVGSTGRATGPHLHFGLRWRGARIDPTLLLGDPARVSAIGPSSQPSPR